MPGDGQQEVYKLPCQDRSGPPTNNDGVSFLESHDHDRAPSQTPRIKTAF
jgi:hypothetical protein